MAVSVRTIAVNGDDLSNENVFVPAASDEHLFVRAHATRVRTDRVACVLKRFIQRSTGFLLLHWGDSKVLHVVADGGVNTMLRRFPITIPPAGHIASTHCQKVSDLVGCQATGANESFEL